MKKKKIWAIPNYMKWHIYAPVTYKLFWLMETCNWILITKSPYSAHRWNLPTYFQVIWCYILVYLLITSCFHQYYDGTTSTEQCMRKVTFFHIREPLPPKNRGRQNETRCPPIFISWLYIISIFFTLSIIICIENAHWLLYHDCEQ